MAGYDRKSDVIVKWITERKAGRDGRDGQRKGYERQRDGEQNEDEYVCLEDELASVALLMKKHFSSFHSLQSFFVTCANHITVLD